MQRVQSMPAPKDSRKHLYQGSPGEIENRAKLKIKRGKDGGEREEEDRPQMMSQFKLGTNKNYTATGLIKTNNSIKKQK